MVFGDLLITRESDAAPNLKVPAISEDVGDFFGESGWVLSGLHQKVCIISEVCAIAWAGSYLGALIAVAGLRNLAAASNFTLANIKEFLVGNQDLEKHAVSLVGWFREEKTIEPFYYGYGVQMRNSPKLGYVQCAGSGLDAMRQLIEVFDGSNFNGNENANPGEFALTMGLNLAVNLLRAEHTWGMAAPTLRSFFGGGYELAMYHGGKFQKIGGVTFVLWEAQVIDSSTLDVRINLLLTQSYKGDALLTRSAFVKIGEDGLILSNEQAHVVQPLGIAPTHVTQEDLKSLEIGGPLLCHCISVRRQNPKENYFYTRVQQSENKSLLGISRTAEGTHLFISEILMSDISQSILNYSLNTKSRSNETTHQQREHSTSDAQPKNHQI